MSIRSLPFNCYELKSLLQLCTKEVEFSFNDELYIQADGIAMGSPLGPLFANVFMCELENHIVPQLENHMVPWYRYVDDTFTFINPNLINNVLEKLNAYHPNIQFTYELEKFNKISFLNVLVSKMIDGKLTTTVYRKPTNTDLYINWYSHSPNNWKVGTFTNLVRRAVDICSNDTLLETELKYLEKVFLDINQYPYKVVKEVISKERNRRNVNVVNSSNNVESNEVQQQEMTSIVSMNLPYAGFKGENIINKLKKDLRKKVNIKTQVTYKAKKLGSKFLVKDEIKFANKHNITYEGKCPTCENKYVGQTKCRCVKRIIQHNSKDKQSNLLRHSKNTKHTRVWLKDFKIIGTGYSSDFKRKMSEALHIKELKPELNIQKDSYSLKLFN